METIVSDSENEDEQDIKKYKAMCCGEPKIEVKKVKVDPLYQLQMYIKKPIRKKCLLYDDSSFKLFWETFIYFTLLAICAILPLNMALKTETQWWCRAYYTVDTLFFIDLLINFNSTIPKCDSSDENDNRGEIVKKYLSSWFLIDIISITPFDYIFSVVYERKGSICMVETATYRSAHQVYNTHNLTRILRVIKLFRMIKLIKLLKSSDRL